jgi:hypothetical protein
LSKSKPKKSHLPKVAPKRTGKRLPRPEDPEDVKNGAAEEAELLTVPRQKKLPTMEDNRLEDLEDTALRYAEIRDERQALTRREVDAKDVLHTLMRRHEKVLYRVETMEIKIVAKDETVKVKILKDKDE